MDFQMYNCPENTEIVINDFSPVESSMDNEEYFDWTDSLKLDEKFTEEKNGRKRKLNGNSSAEVSKLRANGIKVLKGNTETNIEAVKQSVNKKSDGQNEGKWTLDNFSNIFWILFLINFVFIGNSRMPQWQVDDITDLNADIEGSLNGLGSELSNNSYNMSDAILSISGLTVFKQEAPSPPISQDVNAIQMARQNNNAPVTTQSTVISQSNTISDSNANVINTTLHQLLGQTGYSTLQNAIDSNLLPSPPSLSQDGFAVVSSASSIEDCRFQYVLAAATSIATKINEDTLTYLNQGQSYEIKLKKLGDLSTYKGKLLKSVIRICFHERRLQYMEKEQMTLWQKSRPGDRILEVDVPLSYGLCDVSQPSSAHNTIHFSWDPTKEVGVYIKVNCISTEFTPKKHGGEKGVPFRIQVETYQVDEGSDTPKRLHAAVCQIKVFKLKGADRKHKQDREKIMKRPPSEQEKYQPSYECTVLSDVSNKSINMILTLNLQSMYIDPELYFWDLYNVGIYNLNDDKIKLTKFISFVYRALSL
ncbi:transcription factor cp2 [Holotrichia oblita]|uniref:Transcription factor cp2 n=1 Tax=Holotrichia oblita TaxID=644536 RepID=A0ACB9TPH3_HOLOL|nr:transcription factor cp2 [Holotrichia oblita]